MTGILTATEIFTIRYLVDSHWCVTGQVEDDCSAPQTFKFWDQIFADMSEQGGLAVYKQDHGGGEIVQLEAAQRNISVMENWLRPQAMAAAKHNVSKMLCGSISSFWMQVRSWQACKNVVKLVPVCGTHTHTHTVRLTEEA